MCRVLKESHSSGLWASFFSRCSTYLLPPEDLVRTGGAEAGPGLVEVAAQLTAGRARGREQPRPGGGAAAAERGAGGPGGPGGVGAGGGRGRGRGRDRGRGGR